MAGTMNSLKVFELIGTAVSMESGLDGRNNSRRTSSLIRAGTCLNGVRPRWPEQSCRVGSDNDESALVSMESGLDGRNNLGRHSITRTGSSCLNGVRPRWPEQYIARVVAEGRVWESQWSPA